MSILSEYVTIGMVADCNDSSYGVKASSKRKSTSSIHLKKTPSGKGV
jgi:hypothetical protein